MNRNQNSHFSKNPQVDIQRSRFDRSHSVKLSGNVGDLIPFYCDEVLPGDTFQIDTSKLVRLQTLVTPVMDNIYLDTYYFFVPCRLLWEHWREMMGENTSAPWFPVVEYSVPQVTSPVRSGGGSEFGWAEGTIADYMGIPPYIGNLSVSALPFRAYALIWNEWFRDENLQTPQSIPLGDDATDKPHGNKHGGPALDGLALEIFYQGKDNHDDCHQGHRQTQEGDEPKRCYGERSDAIYAETQHLGKRILALTSLTSLAVVIDESLSEAQLAYDGSKEEIALRILHQRL